MSKVDPRAILERPDLVAARFAASELFAMLRRSFDLPPGWSALVIRTDQERQRVLSGGTVRGDQVESVVFLRATPFEVDFEEEGFVSSDQFGFRIRGHVRLSIVQESGDMASFVHLVLGSSRVATVDVVERYFQPVVREALSRWVSNVDAESLHFETAADAAKRALVEAVEPGCFTAGLVISPSVAIRFESPAFAEVCRSRELFAKRKSELDAARQTEAVLRQKRTDQVDHLESLLSRLRELSTKSPETPLGALIRTFSESERGKLYESLFFRETGGSRTRWLIVAVGEELLYFDPRSPASPQRRFAISGKPGPVRSIQMVLDADGSAVLLLGAARGVYRMALDHAGPEDIYLASGEKEVRGGFNSVVQSNGRLFASHSELGIHEWAKDSPGLSHPLLRSLTRNADTIRCLSAFEGMLYCAVDDRIVAWPADGSDDRPSQTFTGSRSAITSISPACEGLFAGNSDGDILRWAVERPSEPEILHQGFRRPAETVLFASVQGVPRLFYTDTSLHVFACVPGDSFLCRYEAGGQTLRRAYIADDLIVATNELRDRLICWSPNRPQRPEFTISVAALCGRSVQDVCLVPDTV